MGGFDAEEVPFGNSSGLDQRQRLIQRREGAVEMADNQARHVAAGGTDVLDNLKRRAQGRVRDGH